MPGFGPVLVRRGIRLRQRQIAGRVVGQCSQIDSFRRFDLGLRAIANKDRLAAPHRCDRLTLFHRREIEFHRSQRLRAGVGVHLRNERPERDRAAHGRERAAGNNEKVSAVGLFFC